MSASTKHAGIAGAGLLGRLLAWRLAVQGWQVSVFEQGDEHASAAYAAGGMLAPQAEQEIAPQAIYDLGMQSLQLWQQWLPQLAQQVHWQQQGSLFVAHATDMPEMQRIVQRMQGKVTRLEGEQVQQLEPELNFQQAYWLQEEGYIDARGLLGALVHEAQQCDIKYHWQQPVQEVSARKIKTQLDDYAFDLVFDCRGSGAQDQFSDLRSVRGELVYVLAPEVNLSRPIRLMHPRYRVYIVPRADHTYLIGASEIEADDDSPMSVRTAMELLSAAYTVHSGFAEARIIEMTTAKRPALADNLPRVTRHDGCAAINGLYRHGFLLAPALVQEVLQ